MAVTINVSSNNNEMALGLAMRYQSANYFFVLQKSEARSHDAHLPPIRYPFAQELQAMLLVMTQLSKHTISANECGDLPTLRHKTHLLLLFLSLEE